jgi:hypothetical protein
VPETLTAQAEHTNHEQRECQQRYDLQTYFAEQVNGSMRTDFEMYFDGADLVSEDGRSLDETTKIGQQEARAQAKANPKLRFEVRRRDLEREEFQEAVEMARGDRPNTIIAVSDFPQELVGAKQDVGGYNVTRQQTMLRILTRQPDGNVHMYSQSLDGSNRQALEAIYGHFGLQPEAGELLGQRINVDLSAEQQSLLADELTGVYDRELETQHGGQWHAGRRPTDYRNTYEFVCRQQDLVEECIRLDDLGWLNDKFMYGVAAEMNDRFIAEEQETGNSEPRPIAIDPTLLHHAIEQAGAEARRQGMSFSACGVTLNADGSSGNQFEQAGYGNKSDEDCEFVSKQCPMCGAKNVKTKVTKNSISGSCGCSKSK